MFIQSLFEVMQTISELEKSLNRKTLNTLYWVCMIILHKAVTLSVLYLYTHSPLQKIVHSIIYWISWRVSIFIDSLWLCWWTHDAALLSIDLTVYIQSNLHDLHHSLIQMNALYSFKFFSSIFFIIWNCFRTSA